MNHGWGDDPNKWVIKKSAFGGWSVFPPHDGEAWIHPSFEAALDVVRGQPVIGTPG